MPRLRQDLEESFGLHGLHTPAEEIARTLLVVMRRGSLSAAREITGHKHEMIGEWLCRAGKHAEAVTHALVHDPGGGGDRGRRLLVVCRKRRAGAPDRPGEAQVVGEPAEPGPRRECVSLERKSRFVIAWQAAASEAQTGT